VGARVRCEGLTGAAELNGCLGRVVSHEGARAKVRMDAPGGGGGGRVVSVKPQNLVVVRGATSTAASANLNVNPVGDWTTQTEDPVAMYHALGPEVMKRRAAQAGAYTRPLFSST